MTESRSGPHLLQDNFGTTTGYARLPDITEDMGKLGVVCQDFPNLTKSCVSCDGSFHSVCPVLPRAPWRVISKQIGKKDVLNLWGFCTAWHALTCCKAWQVKQETLMQINAN